MCTFVMATTEVHKIPNTILSRCQRFDFRRIPTARDRRSICRTICERDGMKFEAEALWTIARQGDGSMRDAQSLLEQMINFSGGQITLANDHRYFWSHGSPAFDGNLDLADSAATAPRRGSNSKLLSLSLDPKYFCSRSAGTDSPYFALENCSRQNPMLVDLPDSEKEALTKLAGRTHAEDLHLLFDMALKGAQDLGRATDPQLGAGNGPAADGGSAPRTRY